MSLAFGGELTMAPQLARHLPPGVDPAVLRPLDVLAGEIATTTDRLLDLLGQVGDETALSIGFDRQRATFAVVCLSLRSARRIDPARAASKLERH